MMLDAFAGPRRPSWRYTLFDDLDRPLRTLDGVTGKSCTVSATTRLGGSASVSIDELGQGIDWMRHRIQIAYNPGIAGIQPWPVGTYLFTSPKTTVGDDRTTHDVALLSKMAIIDEDSPDGRFSLAAGTQIIPTVVALIQGTGETRISVTDSTATLTGPYVADDDASTLTIINELLKAAGYWSLWCDGTGQYRVEPYILPADRPTAYRFAEGEASIHRPEWQRTQDLSSVPNRYKIIGSGSDDTPALTAVATNEDPESPFSYQARGRWITRTESGAEGTQPVLDALAQRRLIDAMSPVATLTVTHAIVPLDPNQAVRFTDHDHDVHATIQSMSYDLTYDGHCTATWREIR